MMRAAALIGLLCANAAQAGGYAPTPVPAGYTDAQAAAAAPVQTVNTQTGNPVIPTVQRQVSGALDASPGTITWTFPTAFAHMPTCWISLAYSGVGYSFDQPIVSAISTSAVTLGITAHPTSVKITGLTLPITLALTTNPPSGTTVTLSCVGALP